MIEHFLKNTVGMFVCLITHFCCGHNVRRFSRSYCTYRFLFYTFMNIYFTPDLQFKFVFVLNTFCILLIACWLDLIWFIQSLLKMWIISFNVIMHMFATSIMNIILAAAAFLVFLNRNKSKNNLKIFLAYRLRCEFKF